MIFIWLCHLRIYKSCTYSFWIGPTVCRRLGAKCFIYHSDEWQISPLASRRRYDSIILKWLISGWYQAERTVLWPSVLIYYRLMNAFFSEGFIAWPIYNFNCLSKLHFLVDIWLEWNHKGAVWLPDYVGQFLLHALSPFVNLSCRYLF